jgi:tetratricopeptide (TPR) repeat protein
MKRISLCILFLQTTWALGLSPVWGADQSIVLSEAVQLRIADAFVEDAEYYRAITEYKKFVILFPGSEILDYVHFRIGVAYYRGEEYEKARSTFVDVRKRFGKSPYAVRALYMEALCHWRLKEYDQARITLQGLRYQDPSQSYASLALLAKALIAFDAENTQNSRHELDSFLDEYPEHPAAEAAQQALALISQYESIPLKSETLAGALSALVPGSGYVYAGRYGDGAMAFIVNALFIAGTLVAVHQENYAVAGIVGGIGLPFYIGNIYGSAAAARKWNITVRRDVRDRFFVTLDFVFK